MNFIALAGFARVGLLGDLLGHELGKVDDKTVKALAHLEFGVLLLMCLGMAVLGALFFFANSLWDKLKTAEVFDYSTFWGGLWFRIGEAIIFTTAIFVALTCAGHQTGCVLLLLSLFVGMFLKSGEALIAGLATRVFASFSQLVPTPQAGGTKESVASFQLSKPGGSVPSSGEFSTVVQALAKLKGMKDVKGPFDSAELRVRFEPDALTVDEIKNTILMNGFDVMGVAPPAPGGTSVPPTVDVAKARDELVRAFHLKANDKFKDDFMSESKSLGFPDFSSLAGSEASKLPVVDRLKKMIDNLKAKGVQFPGQEKSTQAITGS